MKLSALRHSVSVVLLLMLAACAAPPVGEDASQAMPTTGLSLALTLSGSAGAPVCTDAQMASHAVLMAPRPSLAALLSAKSLTLAALPFMSDDGVTDDSADETLADARDVSYFKQVGRASWYGRDFHGRRTANGERFDMNAMTAAHRTLPLSSYVRVTNRANGESVVVRINDRGPFHTNRVIDLSYAAAKAIDLQHQGVGRVQIVGLSPEQARAEMSGDNISTLSMR